jgi:hypothetical protein
MTIAGNLFDLHKTRIALISENNRELSINYRFTFDVIKCGRNIEENKSYDFAYKKNGDVLEYKFKDKRTFLLKISLQDSDFLYLYKVTQILAYIFGANLKAYYYPSGFPFYPAERYLNIQANSNPVSYGFFRDFLNNPWNIIELLINLLDDKNSVCHRTLPALLQINALSFRDLVFTVEYALLEGLSETKIPGTMYYKKTEEYKKLKEFSDKTQNLLSTCYPGLQTTALLNKLNVDALNYQVKTKEKIKMFLHTISSQRIQERQKYVARWAKLRNQLIVHGLSKTTSILKDDNYYLAQELHLLHLDLLDYEICNKLKYYGKNN